MRRTKSAPLALAVFCTVAWLAAGCGDDDDDTGVPSKGGTGGSNAGRGGSAGAGKGAGGAAAHAGGGSAGALAAGRGGAAGSGGRAGGGSGGSGGMCANEVARRRLNDACPLVPTAAGSDESSPLSSCTLEASCSLLHCGEPTSPFDADGCYRTACLSSTACANGERCVAPILLTGETCVPSTYGNPFVNGDCDCDVGVSGDCSQYGYCLPAADHPATADCDPAGKTCEELALWAQGFDYYPSSGATDLEQAFIACRKKLERAYDACSGNGGAAGMGGASGAAGAGAGGEAGQVTAGSGG